MKKYFVVIMAVLMALCLCACGKSEAVKAAEEKIAAIGEVTLDSEKRISAAEKAVEKLSDDELKQLDKAEELKKAREAYEELVLENKAAAVDSVIDQIGEVTLESAEKINAAQQAFEQLTEKEKGKVKNASLLNQAEEKLAALQKQEKEAKRAEALKLLENMRLDEDKVRHLKFYYPKAWRFNSYGNWIADTRCFILPYIGMDDNGNIWMRVVYNFTDDDWVFFKKITVAADDERYYRSFKYFDIVRDNDGGQVWEYIDTDGASDVTMLWAIVNSKETIVRFEGDDYSHDFTVRESDKQAIKEALLVYEGLK